jgi:hypothetical protein
MKIMIKLMLLALVGAVVAPMFIKGPDGKPIFTLQDLISSPAESAYVSPRTERSTKITTVYKWQDEDGQWHFADNQSQGHNHQQLKYNSNANVIQSMPKKEIAAANGTLDYDMPQEYAARAVSNRTRYTEEEEVAIEELGLDPEIIKHFRRASANNDNNDAGSAGNTNFAPGFGMTIPLSEVPKLLEQAKEVQALLDERNKRLEEALGRELRD